MCRALRSRLGFVECCILLACFVIDVVVIDGFKLCSLFTYIVFISNASKLSENFTGKPI